MYDAPGVATLVIHPAASGDAERFGHGDLHMIDIVTIPDRFEERVGKPKEIQPLHRLFPEEMIDSEYR